MQDDNGEAHSPQITRLMALSSSGFPRACLALATLALLAACNGKTVQETIGLQRPAPDEYRVVSRPPLSVPPDFTLRPPQPGDVTRSIEAKPADSIAQSLVLGNGGAAAPSASVPDTAVKPVEVSPAASPSDAQFLSSAGAAKADPNIREKLFNDKTTGKLDKKSSWYKKFTFTSDDKKDNVIDPTKEAKRLKQDNIPVEGPGAQQPAAASATAAAGAPPANNSDPNSGWRPVTAPQE
jgi:hypothetical protein